MTLTLSLTLDVDDVEDVDDLTLTLTFDVSPCYFDELLLGPHLELPHRSHVLVEIELVHLARLTCEFLDRMSETRYVTM